MKNGIDLLRDLSTDLPADTDPARALLPQGKLRFMLEYASLPNLDAERQRLAQLLKSDQFELLPLPGDQGPDADQDEFGQFLILQFPTLDRTLSQRSLFDIGYALEAELGLMSAEPDLGSDVYVDPRPPGELPEEQVEGVIRDAFTARCWVDKDAPTNKLWALEKMRIPQAWALAPSQGDGILIAQPDTGICPHDDLTDSNFRLDLATNLVEGTSDPTDPLHTAAANPGHGTGTSSVITSKASGMITGAAPGAGLIPIRCVDDVKIFDAAPVIAAINHARNVGSHVITMSLGGIPSRAMKKAIRRAVASDIIVVTAAGNCVDLVVWPARYRDVIGVGGSNIDDLPWKGSSRGADVDISAPAELVWVARRRPGDTRLDFTEGAQGTSFATALTASAAALWLSHHGRDALIQIAHDANLTLQELFRRALKATATRPANWPVGEYGAGVVNAEALLTLAPADILNAQASHESAPAAGGPTATDQQPSPAALSATSTVTQADALLASLESAPGQLASSGTAPASLRRFEREIGASLLEAARLGAFDDTEHRIESVTAGFELSDTLKAVIKQSDDTLLDPLRTVHRPPPAARVAQPLASSDISSLTRLTMQPGQGVESAGTRGSQATRPGSAASVVTEQLDALEKRIDTSPLSRDTTPGERQRLKNEVMEDTESVLHRLNQGERVQLTDVRANTALEALVKMKGRPAIRLDETSIDIDDPNLQEWVGVLAMLQDTLPLTGMSVGRIDADGIHQGTGFVVGPGIVLTNRHVIEGFAAPVPSALRPDRWLLERDATINFSPDADDPTQRFRIEDVLFSGPDPISGDPLINHDELDMAVVAVETVNATGRLLPPALSLGTSARKTELHRSLFLIGYPAAPGSFPKDENGRNRADVVERIRQLFGMDYGVCYLSPGLVEKPVSALGLGRRPISFTHDATSLGGSSGSCLLSCDSALDVIGLHYGGDWLRANFAHDLAHVSNTLIKLPELIRQLAESSDQGALALASAAQASKVTPDIRLSATAVL